MESPQVRGDKVSGALDSMPGAERVTPPPPGLAIDTQGDLSETDQAIMQSVQDAIQRRPGPRLGRALRPAPAAPLDIPVECKGAGCLARAALGAVAQRCKDGRECTVERAKIGL